MEKKKSLLCEVLILTIQQELVQAHRYLVHEGDMKILISDEKAEKKRVFIFNDMLLVASYVESTNDEKKKGKGFIYKYQFSFPWIGSWVYLLPNCEGIFY